MPDATFPSRAYSENVNFDQKEFLMHTQTLTDPTKNCYFVVTLQPADLTQATLVQACSRDYGFDFDEEEIGRKLLAPFPAKLSSQDIHEIEADEFEQAFQCFLS